MCVCVAIFQPKHRKKYAICFAYIQYTYNSDNRIYTIHIGTRQFYFYCVRNVYYCPVYEPETVQMLWQKTYSTLYLQTMWTKKKRKKKTNNKHILQASNIKTSEKKGLIECQQKRQIIQIGKSFTAITLICLYFFFISASILLHF